MGTLGVSPKRCHYDGMPGDKVDRDLFVSTVCPPGLLPSTPGGSDLLLLDLDSHVQSPDTDLMWNLHITKKAVL